MIDFTDKTNPKSKELKRAFRNILWLMGVDWNCGCK